MTFGEVTAYYLEQQGMTQSDLARAVGTNRSTINCIIKNERRSPTLETALAISNALGVPLQDMVAKMREA